MHFLYKYLVSGYIFLPSCSFCCILLNILRTFYHIWIYSLISRLCRFLRSLYFLLWKRYRFRLILNRLFFSILGVDFYVVFVIFNLHILNLSSFLFLPFLLIDYLFLELAVLLVTLKYSYELFARGRHFPLYFGKKFIYPLK